MNWILDNENYIKEIHFDELLINVEKSIPVGYTTSVCQNFKASGFFRARSHNHMEGILEAKKNKLIPFKHDGEFWNMPEHLKHLIRFGRCNIEGESMFYCSTDKCTSILEAKPSKGEYVSVAFFELKSPEKFSGSKVNFIGREYLSKIPEIDRITQFSLESRDNHILEIDSYLDELFHRDVAKDEEYLYKLSSAVTKCMMKDILTSNKQALVVDALIYSSMLRDKKSYNIVYVPNHVEMNYQITKIETFKVVEDNSDMIVLRKNRSGHTPKLESTNLPINWFTKIEDNLHIINKNPD
jgi:hypothetical protein